MQGKLGCWCSYGWVFLLLILVIVSLVVSNLSVYFLMRDGCSSKIHRLREGAALEGLPSLPSPPTSLPSAASLVVAGRGTEVWSAYRPPTPAGPAYPNPPRLEGPNRRTPPNRVAAEATFDPFRGLREEISKSPLLPCALSDLGRCCGAPLESGDRRRRGKGKGRGLGAGGGPGLGGRGRRVAHPARGPVRGPGRRRHHRDRGGGGGPDGHQSLHQRAVRHRQLGRLVRRPHRHLPGQRQPPRQRSLLFFNRARALL